jgi:UDP-galactopyranose mutase
VIFFEEPVFGGSCRAHLDVKNTEEGVTVVTPVLPKGLNANECVIMQRCLLNNFLATRGQEPKIAWYYTPMALQFSAHLKFDCVVYDCMDELSAFNGAPACLQDLENELLAKADVVFTGGQALYEAKKSQHQNLHAFPSSIDRAHFAKARVRVKRSDPADQKHIMHPRIGFFGVIDERMDLELLRQVAMKRPDMQFIMIGPVVKIDPETLPRLQNIHWLGQKDYMELPSYMAHWDAGFMPFAINEATKYISPTNTPEFLAAGLPVVSTAITDVIRAWGKPRLVRISHNVAEMCKELDRAVAVDRSLWLKRVDQALSAMSWDATFAAMLELVEAKLPANRREPLARVVAATSTAGEAHA